MNGGSMKVADRVLEALAASEFGAAVVMLASTEKGCGAYGRVAVDPWESIEVRLFGWPMLTPGHVEEQPKAIASVLRLGFVFDGTDWRWKRRFVPALVPVAAHAAARALSEAWQIAEHEADRLVDVRALELSEVALIASECACERCVTESCGRAH